MPERPVSAAQLDALVERISAALDADELLAEPVTDDERDYARGLAARLRGAARGPRPQSAAQPVEWEWDLWLLLEGAAPQFRSGPAQADVRPVTAQDPGTGAVVVVRPGPEPGSWDVRLAGAEPGRYRISLGWVASPGVTLAVELRTTAGTTARAVTGSHSQGSPPDRARLERLDG